MLRQLLVLTSLCAAAEKLATIEPGVYNIINAAQHFHHGLPLAYRKHEYLQLKKTNPIVDWDLQPTTKPHEFVLRNVYKGEYYANPNLFDNYINFKSRDVYLTAKDVASAGKFVAISAPGKPGLYYLRHSTEKDKWLTNHFSKVHLSRLKKTKWNVVDARHYQDVRKGRNH